MGSLPSESQYRKLVEHLPIVIYRNAPGRAGHLLYVSPQVETLLGASPEECLSHPSFLLQAVHPADRERVMAHKGSPLPPDGKSLLEYRLLTGDGRVVWVRDESMLLRTDDGEPLYVQGVLADITEWKQAEAALRESEERLRLAIDGCDDGFWDYSVLTGEVKYSRRWAEMIGYAEDEIEPHRRAWEALIHPDDAPAVLTALDDLLAGHTERYQVEHRLRAKSGEWQWVLSRGKVVARDEAGRPLRAAGTHTDIVERKRAEEALVYTSLHDRLTGLYNRAYFEEELHRLEGGRDYPITIVSLDVDGLKLVNDTMGHRAGDELLQACAQVLRACFRKSDLVARIGGDEFAVVLTRTHSAAAESVCRRLDEQIEAHPTGRPDLPLSASWGFHTADSSAQSLEEALTLADRNMYREKLRRASRGRRVIEALRDALAAMDGAEE